MFETLEFRFKGYSQYVFEYEYEDDKEIIRLELGGDPDIAYKLTLRDREEFSSDIIQSDNCIYAEIVNKETGKTDFLK